MEAHAALEESKLRLGVRTKMSGNYGKTGDDSFAMDTRDVSLRRVG